MRYPVDGKIVLITGASSGIGRATATALHARGASVVVAARRREPLEVLAAELGTERVLVAEVDVTDAGSVAEAVAAATGRFGGLDVVIANAGTVVDPPATIASVDEAEFERVIDVDLLGVWRTVRACLPQIMARRGHALLTASVYAFANGAANAAYAASKAGVEQLGRALRAELAPHGATAGVLYPGWVSTPMIRPAFGGSAVATELLRIAYPKWLRTPIPPEQAAAAAVRGIERRSAQIVVPARWLPISVMRGAVNPAIDRMVEHRPQIRGLLAELEREAFARSGERARPDEGGRPINRRPAEERTQPIPH